MQLDGEMFENFVSFDLKEREREIESPECLSVVMFSDFFFFFFFFFLIDLKKKKKKHLRGVVSE